MNAIKVVMVGIVGLVVSLPVLFLGALLRGLFIMLLWEWLGPDVFHMQVVTFWQYVGIGMLSRALFGSGDMNTTVTK